MALLMTKEVADLVEASGNDLADICQILSEHRRGINIIPRFTDIYGSAVESMEHDTIVVGMQFLVRKEDDSVTLVLIKKGGGFQTVADIWDSTGTPI